MRRFRLSSARARHVLGRAPLIRRVVVRWYAPRLLARGRAWADVERAFRLLAGDPRPRLIAGPWTGSTSEELLYWIPFLRWAIESNRIDPKRVVAVSPGGAASWYDGLCGRFVSGDETDVRGVRIDANALLSLVDRYRNGREPLRPILRHARHRRLDAKQAPARRYVCVACAGCSADARAVIEQAAATLQRRVDVVSLDAISDENPPPTFDAISATIAGAEGLFVPLSTFAYLGQLFGVATIAIDDDAAPVREPDKEAGRRAGRELESPATILTPPQLRALLGLLPAIADDVEEGREVID